MNKMCIVKTNVQGFEPGTSRSAVECCSPELYSHEYRNK